MADAVAIKEFGAVITSSPSPIPKAIKLKNKASDPLPTPIANRVPQYSAKLFSNFSTSASKIYDPFVESADLHNAEKTDLETVCTESDIITVHTPLLDGTKNLINKKYLDLMKPSTILINAARGGIVNEDDLYTTLAEKKIRGAGVDVYSSEPLEETSKLRELDNIVLTPHLGASTEEAQSRVGLMAINQLKEFFINENLTNEVRT